MNVVFITVNDHLFLPSFFDNVFYKSNTEDKFSVILVKPIYKKESTASMVLKYLSTFGVKEFTLFSLETCYHHLLNLITRPEPRKKAYSVASVVSAYGHEKLKFDSDVNDDRFLKMMSERNVDVIYSIGCPQLFKKKLIQIPLKGCLNLHGALLPQYRGILPSFWMLKHQEPMAGNSLFFVNERIDGGDVLLQEAFPIYSTDTLRSLIRRSKMLASEMILRSIELIRTGEYGTTKMEVGAGSYYGWPSRTDYREFIRNGRRIR